MLKIRGRLLTLHLDINKFNQQFKTSMIKNLKSTVKAWLMATSGRVPIWSGMALGSLLEVSETVGGGLIITPRIGVKSRIGLGRAMGSLDAIYGPDEYSMLIKTKVPHYVLQEHVDVGVSKTAPWKSFDAGNKAAIFAMRNINIPVPTVKKKVINL